MTVLRRPQKNEVKKLLVVVCYMTPLNIVFNEENSNGCPAREPRKNPVTADDYNYKRRGGICF
jgi:hypothetical protein